MLLRRFVVASAYVLFSAAAANPERVPVLVELFTSEGCSSCPPGDRLLEQLDPQAVVLGEHVDYWDHQGWRDRFSSHAFTERQENYARWFGLDSPYTPQMVVDGAAELNGSDNRRAAEEIAKAAARPKAHIELTADGGRLLVRVSGAPDAGDVMLAFAENSAASQVKAGENRGRELHHVAIVRALRKIGSVKRGELFTTHIDPGPGQRVVVFVQEPVQRRVIGAAVRESFH